MKLILWSIFLGPWAKESFIFIAPIIFFYASINKKKQILYFLLSGVLVFTSRFIIDYYSGASSVAAIQEDLDHFNNISTSMSRLFSFHGLYEVFSVTGFWILLLIPALFNKSLKRHLQAFAGYEWWFVAVVFFQAAISTDIARMLFLATPVLALLWGRIISEYFQGNIRLVTSKQEL